MSQYPLVTIITPAYNRVDLIGETIESVLAQDYPNLEYIVIDDGSTDGTLEIIRRYGDKLIWKSHANVGEACTVNYGFTMAKGELIGVVNSDDPLLPGAVSRMSAALIEHQDAVVAYPDWRLIDENGSTLKVIHSRDYVSFADMVRGHHCLPGPGALFRLRVLDRISGRDPFFRYVGDMDFWYRVAHLGGFVRVPEVLATFRVHGKSASVFGQSELMAKEHIAVIEKILDNQEVNDRLLDVKRESMLNAYHAAACHLGFGRFVNRAKYIIKSISCSPTIFIVNYKYRLIIYLLMMIGINYGFIRYNMRGIRQRLAIIPK